MIDKFISFSRAVLFHRQFSRFRPGFRISRTHRKNAFSLRRAATGFVTISALIISQLSPLMLAAANAATFTWDATTGNWSTAADWTGGVAPTSIDPTTVLIFGGGGPAYTATDDIAPTPFQLN